MKIIIFLLILNFSISSIPKARISPDKRLFTSTLVEEKIKSLENKFKDPELFNLYENCFPNTLDTTVFYDKEKQDTFIITGDINAMWLRDSSFQLLPYIKIMTKDNHNNDFELKNMIKGTIKRQVNSIILDPYANAFNKNHTGQFNNDQTYKKVNGEKVYAMNDLIWERKYELDSLVSVLFMHSEYFSRTEDNSFIDDSYKNMLIEILRVVDEQSIGQDDEDAKNGWTYFFQRSYSEPLDSLHQGRGTPGRTCGLIRSSFRGSDDATLLPYNIPENLFLVSTFKSMSKIIRTKKDQFLNMLADKMDIISNSVKKAIIKYGIANKCEDGYPTVNSYFVYEVDCYGNTYFIDESNFPSLLSLPFFNSLSEEYGNKTWENTKKRIFSNLTNPYYFQGSKLFKYNDFEFYFSGVSSSHVERGYIWPLAIIMRGLVANTEKEMLESLYMLIVSADGTGFIHESFNINNPSDYTRSWFAWANSFFGLFVNEIIEKYPDSILVKENMIELSKLFLK